MKRRELCAFAAAATRRAVELIGGIKRFVRPGQRVVVKPNIGWDRAPNRRPTRARRSSRRSCGSVSKRARRGWRVVFTRALQAGPKRQEFAPGASYHFGVAVFDATSVNHHIVRDTKTLQLVAGAGVSSLDQ